LVEREQAKLKKYDDMLEPAGNDYVQKMLTTIAVTLNVDLPQREGLAMYFKMLSEYPRSLLQQSGMTVLETHKYNTFPKPADFINPIRDEYRDIKKTRDYIARAGSSKPALQARRGPKRVSYDPTQGE